MRAFIYDKFGYYPPEEYSTSFEYEGWFFKLEISEKNDRQIHSLRLLLQEINDMFPGLGSDVIMTRDHHYVTSSEYGPVVLVAIKIGEVNLLTLEKMHISYFNRFNQTKLMISHLRKLWINKTDTIQNRIIPSLPIDDQIFQKLNVLAQFALGLSENAIAYLLDTALYYGDEIKLVTITHKRIDELNSFFLFNPFNLVIDSPMRDLAELYKNNLITLEKLLDNLKKYPLSPEDVSLLLARCIYPHYIFDILEDYYELKKDVRARVESVYQDMDNRMLKLKKLQRFLVNQYGIRPINWLN